MHQLGLPMLNAAPSAVKHVARRELVLRRVATNVSVFREDFGAWLEKNMHLWEIFEMEASAVWIAGRRHYSARTIVEWIRHNMAAREKSGDFKINNNEVPDLARLYVLMWPERADLFELRGREGTQ